MKTLSLLLSLSLSTIAAPLMADALPINPGLWETSVTTTNQFTGTKTEKHQECLTDTEFDPAKMLGDQQQCNVTESTLNGNVLTFSLACNMEGATGTMSGEYQSDGDSGTGTMVMEMSFGGQTMTMESNMTANRLGDC